MPTHHFPFQPTRFVGRTTELAKIRELLADRDCRLLTLVGLGGIGKTRLAMEAAAHHAEDSGQEVYFVALAGLASAESLAVTIGNVLHLWFMEGQDTRQQLLRHLAATPLLLVLDNFEHLLPEASTFVSEMLRAAGSLQILVTSRERLNLVEEWALEIGGLDYPANPIDPAFEHYSAVQLFVQSARHVRVDFTLDANEHDVLHICRLVGGMPLGLELAATWLNILSCREIAEQIQHNIDFLATTQRNMANRHRSLRAVFDYSWQRLSAEEQHIFRRLSVYRGFNREAAGVLGASLTHLSALANKSLLIREPSGRFAIHELLRQYAAERLAERPDELVQAQMLHGQYYIAFLYKLDQDIQSPRRFEAMQAIDLELENILLAWAWAITTREYEEIQRFIWAFTPYAWNRTLYQLAAELYESAARLLEQDDPSPEQEITLGVSLVSLSRFNWLPGKETSAMELAQRSLDIFRRYDCPRETAYALHYLALITADPSSQITLLREARALSHAAGDRWLNGWITIHLALQEELTGDAENAQRHRQEGLALARQIGERNFLQAALGYSVETALLKGDYASVYENALEAVNVSYPANKWSRAGALNNLGHVAVGLGHYEEAFRAFREGLSLSLEGGFRNTMLEALIGMSTLFARLGEDDLAADALACAYGQIPSGNLGDDLALAHVAPNLPRLQAELPAQVISAARARRTTSDIQAVAARILENVPMLSSGKTDFYKLPNVPGTLRPSSDSVLPDEPLSPREIEVLRLMAAGLSNREIADHLVLGVSTIKTHVNHIFGKLGVEDREQAIYQARKLRLL